MKIEQQKIRKIIQQNYSNLSSDFFKMQTDYLASLNKIYNDLDASLVAMVLTSQLYKNLIKENTNKDKISLKHFYQKDSYKLPVSGFKIKYISSLINLPRETVRRKKEKLLKDKVIMLDKITKMYTFNSNIVTKNIIYVQIENLSIFLSKLSLLFDQNKFYVNSVSTEKIKKDMENKFLLYLTRFLDFQISYFSKMKSLMDIESIYIVLLCSLNRHLQNNQKINSNIGINATTIAKFTKIPRTTVLRKITKLQKSGIIKKDEFKRYFSEDFTSLNESKKILSIVDQNVKQLGILFFECFETYSTKH